MLICQLTDLHVCPAGTLAYGTVDTNAMAERTLAAVAAFDPRPDVLLLTGDLVDRGEDAAYAMLRALLHRTVSIPTYALPGNHDQRDAMRRGLGGLLGPAGAAGPDGMICYVIEHLPLRIVMLDTLVPGANHGELGDNQLAFLDQALAAAPERPTVIAMHHPPFATGIGFMDRDMLRDADAFGAVVARHPQVERVLCGHVHRAITGRVAHAAAIIAPPACHQVALVLAEGAPGAYVIEPLAFTVHRWSVAEGMASHIAYAGPWPGPFPFTPP
jgi:3',5'-cyclic AMP phosphodiesterase CpdA